MNEELKNKFKNGMIPDENAFGQLIDEATKETDLSGYATKEEIPVVPDVSQFITLEDIPETDLSNYAKASDIPSLDGLLNQTDAETLYVRKDALPNFEEYAKKTDIPAPQDLSHLATKSEIPDVSSFITLEEIPPTDLSAYAKVSDIPSLSGYATKEEADSTYYKKTESLTLTEWQKSELKGDPFTFSDFTPAQLESLKGDKGDKGDTGTDLTNLEVIQARGGLPLLKDRLDKTDSQLAETAKRTYVDSKVSHIVSGTPKATFANLTDLTIAFPNGAEGVYLTADNGHWYYWNEATWEDGGVYQGVGIANNTIDYKKTDFIELKGVNLFDGVFNYNYSLFSSPDSQGRTVEYVGHRTDVVFMSVVIEIEKDKEYSVTSYGKGNRFTIATVDSLPNEFTTRVKSKYHYSNNTISDRNTRTFTNSLHAKYLIVFVGYNYIGTPIVQVEEGNRTIYKEPKFDFVNKEEKKSINYTETNFIETGKNLFSGDYDKYYAVVSNYDGQGEDTYYQYDNGGNISAVIEIENNATYTVTKFNGGNRFRIALLDELPHSIDTSTRSLYKHSEASQANKAQIHTVQNTFNAKYMVVYVGFNSPSVPVLQIERGSSSSNYEPFQYKLKNNNDTSETKNNIFGFFDVKEEEMSVFESGATTLHQEVYSRYDKLVADYPSYVSKSKIGESVNGFDLFSYSFIPDIKDVRNSFDYKNPKVVLTSGVHGLEKNPVFSIWNFVNLLCRSWRSDETLEYLRYNTDFVIIPIVNPDGFDTNTRRNANNIDLNRDYPEGVVESEDYSDKQPEMQAIIGFIKSEKDVDVWLDYHETGSISGPTVYTVGKDELLTVTSSQAMYDVTKKYQINYPFFPQDEHHKFGWTEDGIDNTMVACLNITGVPSILLEVVGMIRWQPGSEYYNAFANKFGVSLLVNVLMKNIENTLLKKKLSIMGYVKS